MWCETVRDFGDLTFALLPRLAGVAEKAWGSAANWAEHRDALARHARLWAQDGLTFFRSPSVSWADGLPAYAASADARPCDRATGPTPPRGPSPPPAPESNSGSSHS
jgi:hypothetical protein